MLERARTVWRIVSVGVRLRLWIVVAAIGVLFGLATLSFSGSPALWATSFAFSVASIVAVLRDVQIDRRRARELHIINIPDVASHLDVTETYAGWQEERWSGHWFLYSRDLNQVIDNAKVGAELRGRYQLPEDVREHRYMLLRDESRKGHILFNGKKLRLAEDLTVARLENASPIHLERTNYFASLCTNEAIGKNIGQQGMPNPRLRGIDACADGDILLDLRQSHCSNHIGISTWVITSDGKLIATVQSARSAKWPNRAAPSGSGSADQTDFRSGDTLRDLIVRAMEREAGEECGIKDARFRTVLIGYARDIERGGKPEFYGLSLTSAASWQVKVPRKEKAYVSAVGTQRVSLAELRRSLAEFRLTHSGGFSPSAHMGMLFLEDALTGERSSLVELLGSFPLDKPAPRQRSAKDLRRRLSGSDV